MKNDGIEESILSMGRGRRRPRTREFEPGLSRRRRNRFVVVWVTVLSSQCWTKTARGFGYPFHTCYNNKTVRRNLGDPKSALWSFQTTTSDNQSDKSDDDDIDDTNTTIESRVDPNAEVPSLTNLELHKSITIGTNPRLNRRTMASVAMGGGVSVTSAIFAGALPSQAIPLSLSDVNENSETVSLSPQNSLPSQKDVVDLPLEYIPTLGAYVVRFVLFGEPFAAIVDTGSPFLTVPCYCKPYRNQKMFWGCYKPELTSDSGYGNTIEGFDNNYGTVVWRKAGFSFSQTPPDHEGGETTSSVDTTDVVFGVLDQDLLNGSGGVFFGLIKETDRWIRPSFLGQTGYKSFCVDLRHSQTAPTSHVDNVNPTENRSDKSLGTPRLVLSKESMIGTGTWRGTTPTWVGTDDTEAQWIPLVRDLRNKYGAPVVHYTAKASDFVVNGLPLLINNKKPLYVIFDTGVSGMVVSQELFDGRYLQARKNKEKSLWGSVEVSFATHAGHKVTLSATKPITTPLGKATPWKGFKGNLIAVGLAFLDGFATTVDVDDGKILFVEG